MENDKWQQCLKKLAEKRPELFAIERNVFMWGNPQGSGFVDVIDQDEVDEIAALLGKRIYVYPVLYNAKSIPLQYSVADLNGNELWAFQTDQTSKLEATKEGLESIVERMGK